MYLCLIVWPYFQFLGLDSGLLREADTQAIAYRSQDFLRGIDAVKAKAPPVFEGWDK
jgi:hypothetical protein